MTDYSDIEIQTAENLLKEGYKWIARDESGGLFAYTDKPIKLDTFWCSDGISNCVCYYVPIFQNVKLEDSEPASLEAIVHPQILDDAERQYLSAVIKPFRDKVKYIEKGFVDGPFGDANYIFIHFNDGSDDMDFPPFREGTMYKGMKNYVQYKPERLGL